MSELFKSYTNPELAQSISNAFDVLARKAHRPAQLTGQIDNLVSALTLIADLAVTDATDADLATFMSTGELSTAKGSAAVANDYFRVNGTGDTTDNALQAAKGSAPISGDVFRCVTSSAVEFLWNAS